MRKKGIEMGFQMISILIMAAFYDCYFAKIFVSSFAMIMLHLQIVNVEGFLMEAFGEEYIRYRKKVCRYFSRKRACHDKN